MKITVSIEDKDKLANMELDFGNNYFLKTIKGYVIDEIKYFFDETSDNFGENDA